MTEPQYAEVSQFAISGGQLGDKWVMSLRIWSSGAQHEFLLGELDKAEEIIDEFYKTALAAMRKARRDKMGLVVIGGGDNAKITGAKRRKQIGPKHPGKAGA